jgi:hypothetical protein
VRSLTNSRATHAPPTQHAVRWCLRAAVLALVATQLTACSKTVVWEEEVPLNTGEVIWVKRTVEYSYQGGGGNPFDIELRPNLTQLIEFTWSGKSYKYNGDAGIMLLAISPQKQPTLLAPAANRQWNDTHGYACVVPFYVQLMPDTTRKKWSWPPTVEPWLYGLRSNLLQHVVAPEKMRTRYSHEQVTEENSIGFLQSPSNAKVDPTFKSARCPQQEMSK